MLVKKSNNIENDSYYAENIKDGILKVYKEDDEHFYVKNKNDIIQGFSKSNFQLLPVSYERKIKINRLLNIKETKKEDIKIIDYDLSKANIYVDWSGEYPNLCSGEWKIKIDDMTFPIPEHLIRRDMNTPGTYQT